jgi:uncharacterized protein
MRFGDLRTIGKIAVLAAIAWSLPPRLWRKAAIATSFFGRNDLGGPAYRWNLADRYSASQISAIRFRRRIYIRELNMQIVGLWRWPAWRPEICLLGAEHLQEALGKGRGVILWMAETVFATLIGKMALHDAGFHTYQLTRAQHGFSTTEFGIRHLNPIWTDIEDRFIAGRATIKGNNSAEPLARLRALLAENKIAIVAAVPQTRRILSIPFLRTELPMAIGAIRLAQETGAALLPVFTLAKEDGGFEVAIHEPLSVSGASVDYESVAAAFAKQLERIVSDHPDQWTGWHWLQIDRALPPAAPRVFPIAESFGSRAREGFVAVRNASVRLMDKPFRVTQLLARFLLHVRDLTPLLLPARGSSLRRMMVKRPSIVIHALTCYLASSWDTRTRIARIVDHYKIIDEIAGLVDCGPGDAVDLIKLTPIDTRYRLTLDQAGWLMREGSLIFSLWDGVDRIFHLGFCLANENGQRIAYVGSLQGRNKFDSHGGPPDLLECYRLFTKAAAGMRPRDFLVETFKMFCEAIGVNEIRAVCNANHPQRRIDIDIKLSYDTVWNERGGRCLNNEFFILSTTRHQRRMDQIPAKKRAMYAQRYAMLDAIEKEIRAALSAGHGNPPLLGGDVNEGARDAGPGTA